MNLALIIRSNPFTWIEIKLARTLREVNFLKMLDTIAIDNLYKMVRAKH